VLRSINVVGKPPDLMRAAIPARRHENRTLRICARARWWHRALLRQGRGPRAGAGGCRPPSSRARARHQRFVPAAIAQGPLVSAAQGPTTGRRRRTDQLHRVDSADIGSCGGTHLPGQRVKLPARRRPQAEVVGSLADRSRTPVLLFAENPVFGIGPDEFQMCCPG